MCYVITSCETREEKKKPEPLFDEELAASEHIDGISCPPTNKSLHLCACPLFNLDTCMWTFAHMLQAQAGPWEGLEVLIGFLLNVVSPFLTCKLLDCDSFTPYPFFIIFPSFLPYLVSAPCRMSQLVHNPNSWQQNPEQHVLPEQANIQLTMFGAVSPRASFFARQNKPLYFLGLMNLELCFSFLGLSIQWRHTK